MWRLLLGMVIGGGVLMFMGYKEFKLSAMADSEPQEITCQALTENGPGENMYVTMTEYVTAEYMVYRGNSDSGPWSMVYLPAKVEPTMNNSAIRVILKLKDVKNDDDLLNRTERASITGLIINEIDSIGEEDRALLRDGIPSIQVDKCYILAVDRKPAGAGKIFLFIGGGIALIAGAGVIFFFFMPDDD